MCGISGIYGLFDNNTLKRYINEMVEIQYHRGPDHQDIYVDSHIALGHDRLSILDLTDNGKQPMFNDDKSISIVFNGEIYNFQKLKEQLIKKGYRMKSCTDTEVILYLYEEYGEDCLEYLNGTFAFAIYDKRKEQLFLARDRIGEKPLVYTEVSDGFAFASEIPALKVIPDVDLSYSEVGIGIYMLKNMRHIPAPYTIYKGIKKLEPSTAMIVKSGKVIKKWKYWKIRWEEKNISKKCLLELLDESVRTRLIADVPVSAMLSGGVDSSSIVYEITQIEKMSINTYALGMDKNDSDLIRARYVAEKLGTNHKEYYFDPDRQHKEFKKLMEIYGEPVMLLPLIHAYELCEHIKDDGIKVVLTGNGADEVFYGYVGNTNLALITTLINVCPKKLLDSLLSGLAKKYDNKSIKNAAIVAHNIPGKRKLGLYKNEYRSTLSGFFRNDAFDDVIGQALEGVFDNVFNGSIPPNYIDEANVLGLFVENEHSITISADLSSMANGVEARSPFLNHDLVQMGWNINYRNKVPRIRDKGYLKWPLKNAVRDRLGDDVIFAKKQGFGYNIAEEKVLRGPWKEDLDRSFDEYNDFGHILNVDYIRKLKKGFDEMDSHVKPAVIAKLYALNLFSSQVAD